MTRKVYKIYTKDILDSLDSIERFIGGMNFDSFSTNDEKSSAVIRKLEIIGEAAKNLPEELRQKYSQVDWRGMTGLRDKLIHAYSGVDFEVLWKVIKEDLPAIKPVIQKMLGET